MNKVYILGDIHAQYHHIYNLYQREKLDETDTIILLGDVGANFFLDRRDETFKRQLSKFSCSFFCIRGNHEQRPSRISKMPNKRFLWEKGVMWNNGVLFESKYPKIKYAKDEPSIYNIHGYTTLIIPGAYSPDKYQRKKNISWWEDEQCSEEELKLADSLFKKHQVDLVLSHTCPISYEPSDLYWPGFDQSLIDKTMEREMGHMEHIYNYKCWCWGHFHKFREYPRETKAPSYADPRCVMLFNDYAIELENLMNDKELRKI